MRPSSSIDSDIRERATWPRLSEAIFRTLEFLIFSRCSFLMLLLAAEQGSGWLVVSGLVDSEDDPLQSVLQAVDLGLIQRAGADERGHVVGLRAPFQVVARPFWRRLRVGTVLFVAGCVVSERADSVDRVVALNGDGLLVQLAGTLDRDELLPSAGGVWAGAVGSGHGMPPS